MFSKIRTISTLLLILAAGTMQASNGPGTESRMQYHQVMDRQHGMVQSVFPYPADWRFHGENATVYGSAPGGITLYPSDTQIFLWSNDPMMRQTAWQMGKQVMAPLPMNQVLQQLIVPSAQSQGNRLVRQFPIPAISSFWQRFVAGMPQDGRQRQVEALGTEWTDGRGQRTFVAIVKVLSSDRQSIGWHLVTQSLTAPEAQFERALSDYLYAIGNGQINPNWQAVMNNQHVDFQRRNDRFWAEASANSRAAHHQRMAAINSAGQTARNVGNTYSEILDISHAGYLDRDAIQSGGHHSTINQISGHAIIGNHETGEHYRVEDGHRHYWVNADARYIATDNPLFDPRMDPRIGQENWTRFVRE